MTKVEELRDGFCKDVVADIENLASAWGVSEYLTEKKIQRIVASLDALIAAVAEQTQNQYKEALAAVTAECVKECTRQAAVAFKQGKAEGAEEERERILAESSCIAADDRSLHQSGREFVTGELWYYFPASVLAPPKGA